MKQIKQALSTPMTRKEFLRLIGTGLLTVIGVTNFVSLMSKSAGITTADNTTASKKQTNEREGFGSRKFGV